MNRDPSAKILLRVPNDAGDANVETLWAIPLGDDRYELDNSPFYAYDVSWQDVILAPVDDHEGLPTFQRVVAKSGNRTLRIIFDPPVSAGNASDKVLQGLLALGCSYEGANPGYLSVNVPPGVELQQVSSYLVRHNARWEYADPSYETLFPDGD